ncbi:nicotinate-nucleotide diphosphorylase (carboxylating) [Clostridia bacterium]|nr:nicotinate-nucleotide diphosphorylase (carboxylating) [Clostridia bacterium]
MELSKFEVDAILTNALEEDLGAGDITTNLTVSESAVSEGKFIAKEDGIICGLFVAARVFALVDDSVVFNPVANEGASVKKGDVIAEVKGKSRSILIGERTALNFLQRMSGIAARTADAVRQVAGTAAHIADTRKTTPGLRIFEKYAVRVGGGSNHRYNLADGILIKDNHIAAAGGIYAAVTSAKLNAPHTLKVEVECESIADVNEALRAKADIIMLDNMTNDMMSEAVKLIAGRAVTEASGNMGDKSLREAALTGVDIISIGALTHTVKCMDISLKFAK